MKVHPFKVALLALATNVLFFLFQSETEILIPPPSSTVKSVDDYGGVYSDDSLGNGHAKGGTGSIRLKLRYHPDGLRLTEKESDERSVLTYGMNSDLATRNFEYTGAGADKMSHGVAALAFPCPTNTTAASSQHCATARWTSGCTSNYQFYHWGYIVSSFAVLLTTIAVLFKIAKTEMSELTGGVNAVTLYKAIVVLLAGVLVLLTVARLLAMLVVYDKLNQSSNDCVVGYLNRVHDDTDSIKYVPELLVNVASIVVGVGLAASALMHFFAPHEAKQQPYRQIMKDFMEFM